MKKTSCAVQKPIVTQVTIPGSKSITNRALLLAALSNGTCEISNILLSEDTRIFINALRTLGVKIECHEPSKTCLLTGCSGYFPNKKASIWCGKAGTAARFLLAACAAIPGEYFFDADEQLRRRPLAPLIEALYAQGIQFSPVNVKKMPLSLHAMAPLPGGEIEIDGHQTGQFISALLMVAPLALSSMVIKTNELVSAPYIDMTIDMMAEFGVLVKRFHHGCFSVPVPQSYEAINYIVEPDLSTASYFFAAAAVTGGCVTIQAIDLNKSKQGDREFLSILERMGCQIRENLNGLSVQGPPELYGVSVDMQNCSDTFMTLAAIAPFAKSPTTITNIGHTRFQESDRIRAMRKGLQNLAVRVEEGADWLKIYPSEPQAGVIDAHDDHRIAMAFSVVGLRVDNIEIEDAKCVAKTCPEFFELWEELCLEKRH